MAAVVPTVIVTVEVPEPGALIDVRLKLTVTPEGWPEAESEIEELNDPETAVVTVDVPLLPRATDTAVGDAEIVKFFGAATVKLNTVVCVMPPPTPVIVMG